MTSDMMFWCYLLLQTDGSVPNTLVIANCDVVKPKVAAAEHISQVNYNFFPSVLIFWLILMWHLGISVQRGSSISICKEVQNYNSSWRGNNLLTQLV